MVFINLPARLTVIITTGGLLNPSSDISTGRTASISKLKIIELR